MNEYVMSRQIKINFFNGKWRILTYNFSLISYVILYHHFAFFLFFLICSASIDQHYDAISDF